MRNNPGVLVRVGSWKHFIKHELPEIMKQLNGEYTALINPETRWSIRNDPEIKADFPDHPYSAPDIWDIFTFYMGQLGDVSIDYSQIDSGNGLTGDYFIPNNTVVLVPKDSDEGLKENGFAYDAKKGICFKEGTYEPYILLEQGPSSVVLSAYLPKLQISF
jgi:hypothetical protein